MDDQSPLILLTGASGYVGGRMLAALRQRPVRVRCLARSPEYVQARCGSGVEIVRGDVLDPTSLETAFQGVDVAYYLVHSMGTSAGFEEQDRRAATHFATAARKAGVRRIIYLGGLADTSVPLSPHLRSRHEVGEILLGSGVAGTTLMANTISLKTRRLRRWFVRRGQRRSCSTEKAARPIPSVG